MASSKTSHKRQLSNTDTEAPPPKRSATEADVAAVDFTKIISDLPESTLRNIITVLAQTSGPTSALGSSLLKSHETLLRQRREQVIDFDSYSKSIWHSLNVEHTSKSARRQYDASFEVSHDIQSAIQEIANQAGDGSASAGTKVNAMMTLRKIGKSICMAVDCVGSEIRKGYCGTVLVDGMKEVLRVMNDGEKDQLCSHGAGEYIEKLEELIEIAKGYCIMEGLEEVFGLLIYEDGPDEDEDEDEDDGNQDDDGKEDHVQT